ncbi:DUF6752 domain-containing protein [Aeromicrobium sp. CTD01-1L150]|uniref:DUF6752 domain-containing protein n=1 Tax=Aeromicrobium sp. CTD01-1L150 TaxID=3341830 RepID=UPI0035BFB4C7
MKNKIVAMGERVSPSAMERLRGARARARARARQGRSSEIARLREEVAELQELVAAVHADIDECRRDNIRIAELTDVVEDRLAGRNG